MLKHFDVAVVGAGIVGLAHAWMAARRNLRVVVFERSRQAVGASVRNFGMIWPIGQTAGDHYEWALDSRDQWLQLDESNAVEVEQCGSIHLAHSEVEIAILEEFCSQGSHQCQLLSKAEVVERSSVANPKSLLGGLWSPTELRVDPRTASRNLANWLAEVHKVQFEFDTQIQQIQENTLTSSTGQQWTADRILVCSGSDLQTLYPEVFSVSGLRLCKLQMLKAKQVPSSTESRAHLASGLTLRHYRSFESCPTLSELKQQIAAESPELDQYGIHVMASWFSNGEMILGDSHEYGCEISPFNKEIIDQLILRELQKVIQLDDWSIQQRWHGIYAKHPDDIVYENKVADGVHVFTGTGGAGMTMAFGLADRTWKQWD